MNGHLFTYWAKRRLVECLCGWRKRVPTIKGARTRHRLHVARSGPLAGPRLLEPEPTPSYFVTIRQED